MNQKKVIVAGATGILGSQIVKQLLDQGAHVFAMVRASSNRSALEKMGVRDFVIGDMLDKESLKKALSPNYGYDAVVASAAGYTKSSNSSETDTIGYQNLIDATKEAGIPRFVLISILESDKAVNVPHFHNKFLAEEYLKQKGQPYIALRPGAFFDFSDDTIIKKLNKGVLPVFFYGVDYGTIYTADLAKYAAMAAVKLPDSELNSHIDVGWSEPVNGEKMANAFTKILGKPITAKPVIPSFVINILGPIVGAFSSQVKDMYEMMKWVRTGEYVSSNTEKQKRLFGDLPTIEEALRRYAKDKKLI